MSNQWFSFKEFTICQDRCAMKVGTDGVILGAWTDLSGVRRVLDAGTGTGLLALMLAQRSSDLTVDAIEIETRAAQQARENVANSKYANRIQVIEDDFNSFYRYKGFLYDLVICNPPYFSGANRTDCPRTMARQNDKLSVQQLFTGSGCILKESGKISMIIPYILLEDTLTMAQHSGFHAKSMLNVIPVPGRDPVRTCISLSRKPGKTKTASMVIEQGIRHAYSEEYRKLTKAFYLDF